jgi:hypothetical protein
MIRYLAINYKFLFRSRIKYRSLALVFRPKDFVNLLRDTNKRGSFRELFQFAVIL